MVENSSKDGRLDYETALHQLIIANYGFDKSGNRIPLSAAQIKEYRMKINEEEITQGYLWMSATLSPAKQVIQFAVVDTQNISSSPVTPVNRLLTMQDSFLISNMSYFLQIYSYTGGALANPDFTSGNSWTPVTYVSTWDSNGVAIDFDNGCAIFWIGAYLSLNINKKVVIPYWDCYRHYKAPITQATPGFPVPSNYIPNQKNQHDGSSDGFVFTQPNIVIGGGRDNKLNLNLAANIPAGIAPFDNANYGVNFIVQAVVCMRGILMQNSTTVK